VEKLDSAGADYRIDDEAKIIAAAKAVIEEDYRYQWTRF
jgi:hypothetical protein